MYDVRSRPRCFLVLGSKVGWLARWISLLTKTCFCWCGCLVFGGERIVGLLTCLAPALLLSIRSTLSQRPPKFSLSPTTQTFTLRRSSLLFCIDLTDGFHFISLLHPTDQDKMDDQVNRLVNKVWDKFLQTPPDRRLSECSWPLFTSCHWDNREHVKLGRYSEEAVVDEGTAGAMVRLKRR